MSHRVVGHQVTALHDLSGELRVIADVLPDHEEAGPPPVGLELCHYVSCVPGWTLVGDAGYSVDPGTAQGISDAFRDAAA